MQRFLFIGPGRMGTALSLVLAAAGYEVMGAYTRHPHSGPAQQYCALTGRPVLDFTGELSLLKGADVVFVTVPDQAVTAVAHTLAASGQLRPGQVVVHTAGVLASSALNPVGQAGVARLSLHPLQTVAHPAHARTLLRGAYCALEGDEAAVAQGQQWVKAWGGIPLTLRPEDKPRYHAAAALASNAVVALMAVAASLFPAEGQGLKPLLPLLQGALGNLESLGVPAALTGPVERGDMATVQLHLQALQGHPAALRVYAVLGEVTADLAVHKGSLREEQRAAFIHLLRCAAQQAQPQVPSGDRPPGGAATD
ncbi:MAG: DUF2520 domain-containing protein [Alicyclobacillus sp.]|nr:DUF2520 domain-containing protein [Alicyclobacillus sp.]